MGRFAVAIFRFLILQRKEIMCDIIGGGGGGGGLMSECMTLFGIILRCP